jgi:hypothetical protein
MLLMGKVGHHGDLILKKPNNQFLEQEKIWIVSVRLISKQEWMPLEKDMED